MAVYVRQVADTISYDKAASLLRMISSMINTDTNDVFIRFENKIQDGLLST